MNTTLLHFTHQQKIKQDFNVYMARLDADSIFNTIPLGKNSDTCIDNLCDDNVNNHKIPKNVSRNLLNIVTNKSFFMFNINSINKLMVWLWGIHRVQLYRTLLCTVLKINGSKIALMVWSLLQTVCWWHICIVFLSWSWRKV